MFDCVFYFNKLKIKLLYQNDDDEPSLINLTFVALLAVYIAIKNKRDKFIFKDNSELPVSVRQLLSSFHTSI